MGETPPRSFGIDAGHHNPHKGTFVCGQISNYYHYKVGQKQERSYSAMMLCFSLCFWISTILQSLSDIGVNSGLPEVAPSLHATHFLGMLYKHNHDSLETSFWPSAEPWFYYSRLVWPSWQQRLYVIHLCVLRLQDSGRAYGECSTQVCCRNEWMRRQIITLVWNLRGFIFR